MAFNSGAISIPPSAGKDYLRSMLSRAVSRKTLFGCGLEEFMAPILCRRIDRLLPLI